MTSPADNPPAPERPDEATEFANPNHDAAGCDVGQPATRPADAVAQSCRAANPLQPPPTRAIGPAPAGLLAEQSHGSAAAPPDARAEQPAVPDAATGETADEAALGFELAEWAASAAAAVQATPGRPAKSEVIRYLGDYVLLAEIARGGMGVVYRAWQISRKRQVAVKMISTGQLAGAVEVQRFQAEAEAAAGLRHPNIVAIHEVGQYEGLHFFAMDYIEGKSLSAMIADGAVPIELAVPWMKTIAEAIEYAHSSGILHRDLKPSNILIDASGQPHLTDFGLVKRIADPGRLTASGVVMGTPAYMPPEQVSSRRGEFGPYTDVYSLGAILYELLTRRPPFQARTTLDTLIQVLDTDPVPPRLLNPAVPVDLETICLKCLQKAPHERYATAAALAEDLARFLAGEPIRARPVRPAPAAESAWKAHELEAARAVQQNLLPKELPQFEGWELAAFCRPARTVAGDYYDLFQVDHTQLAIVLADVSTRGLTATLLMASLHALIRSYLPRMTGDLPELMSEVNRYACSFTPEELFAHVFLGLLNVSSGQLRFVNAGHPPPLVLCDERLAPAKLRASGPIVGILPEAKYEEQRVVLQRGSLLALCSNSLTRTENEQGDFFGEERLLDVLRHSLRAAASTALSLVFESLASFSSEAEQVDDIYLMIVARR
jgi:hypothetical protein